MAVECFVYLIAGLTVDFDVTVLEGAYFKFDFLNQIIPQRSVNFFDNVLLYKPKVMDPGRTADMHQQQISFESRRLRVIGHDFTYGFIPESPNFRKPYIFMSAAGFQHLRNYLSDMLKTFVFPRLIHVLSIIQPEPGLSSKTGICRIPGTLFPSC